MKRITLYHNPKCSKSRKALEILQQLPLETEIINYQTNPLDFEQIKKLKSHFDLKDFVRHTDALFKALNLSLENENQVLQAMVNNPLLLQRPIVVYGDKAIIARPPENILAFVSE